MNFSKLTTSWGKAMLLRGCVGVQLQSSYSQSEIPVEK